ncbi:hypothetical protein [Pontibacter fetidus]|uniref:Uncharacterized protein n=1 Tax=Pontibacter fetidus TaxID=2700082 RepID=A0A6B2GWE2_9BACT|nr:hypothetical protein [Pontibacter fetidus]NDK55249.1 hypothetical protein [Pontibacter fetidus]
MKLSAYLGTLLLLTMYSCGPKNQEVTDEQVETGSRTEVLDSVANTREDAVRIDENDTVDTLTAPTAD